MNHKSAKCLSGYIIFLHYTNTKNSLHRAHLLQVTRGHARPQFIVLVLKTSCLVTSEAVNFIILIMSWGFHMTTSRAVSWRVTSRASARGRGRPRVCWLDNIVAWTGLSRTSLLHATRDGRLWSSATRMQPTVASWRRRCEMRWRSVVLVAEDSSCIDPIPENFLKVYLQSQQHTMQFVWCLFAGLQNLSAYNAFTLFQLHICQVCGSFQCPYCDYYNAAPPGGLMTSRAWLLSVLCSTLVLWLVNTALMTPPRVRLRLLRHHWCCCCELVVCFNDPCVNNVSPVLPSEQYATH